MDLILKERVVGSIGIFDKERIDFIYFPVITIGNEYYIVNKALEKEPWEGDEIEFSEDEIVPFDHEKWDIEACLF